MPHKRKPSESELRSIVLNAIAYASVKSSRAILKIEDGSTDEEIRARYRESGKDLFDYFLTYCGDPASTAHQCHNRHYSVVAEEQFRNRTLQKERMNSGWRYQYIAKDGASHTGRFSSVSDTGKQEADFTVTVGYRELKGQLAIYVSVKNRANTVGGQDFPKAIRAMEDVAINDMNRACPYLCVFGIAMDKGGRSVRREKKTNQPYSVNTEIWKSTFFWPFFTNCSYDEIITTVLTMLLETEKPETMHVPIPAELIESFGDCCRKRGLVDDKGIFNDPFKLVNLFCGVAK